MAIGAAAGTGACAATGAGAGAGVEAHGGGAPDARALSLAVVKSGERIAIEVVANSATDQSIDYAIELTGASRSRHRGSTRITAGERHVLSRLSTNAGSDWCAVVEVSESDGPHYTLSAGPCGAV
jgi:hypothetical protein